MSAAEVKYVHVIKLKHPFTRGTSEQITELKFKKCRLGDLGKLKLGAEMSMDSLFPVISKLTGQPIDVIEDLDPEDGMAVLEYVGKLLPSGPQTTSSP